MTREPARLGDLPGWRDALERVEERYAHTGVDYGLAADVVIPVLDRRILCPIILRDIAQALWFYDQSPRRHLRLVEASAPRPLTTEEAKIQREYAQSLATIARNKAFRRYLESLTDQPVANDNGGRERAPVMWRKLWGKEIARGV